MPIYEFECKDCRNVFSKLVIKQDEKFECPSCKSQNVEKKMSKISSVGSSTSAPSCSCSSCGLD